MKTSRTIVNVLAMAFLASAGIASADEITKEGYLTDSRGDVVKNGFGQCWHTGFWNPAMAITECEPDSAKKVEPTMAEAKTPEAKTPVAAPKPVAVTPASRKVAFAADSSADALFGFGKATVTPAGRQSLDKFAADLKGANFELITVTGHTDRIGSHAYNQKLSTRRAETVKAYLVESAGIPSGKITAKGVDGSDPVTKPGECKGKKATKKLIACLAPDRRVEIEVAATRTSK